MPVNLKKELPAIHNILSTAPISVQKVEINAETGKLRIVFLFKYTFEIFCNDRTLTDDTKEQTAEGEFMCAKGKLGLTEGSRKSRNKILQNFCLFPNVIMRLGTADVDCKVKK